MPKKIPDKEEIVKFDDLIYKIVETKKIFNINNVYIFLNKNCQYYSLASAYALEIYLTKLGFNVYLVLKGGPILAKDFAFERVIRSKDIPHNSNNFIGVAIDCNTINEIDNTAWNESFILFEVKGSSHLNNYGIIGFLSEEVICSAEIIYASIKKYEQKHKHSDLNAVYGYLKSSLLDASVNFVAKPRSKSLKIINELEKYDMPKELTLSDEKLTIMQVIQNFYFNTKYKDKAAVTVFNKENGLNKINIKTIKKCLRFMKYIDKVDYWYITIEQDDGTYKTIVQGSKTTKTDFIRKTDAIKKHTKEQNGHIDSGLGEFVCQKKDFDIIAEMRKLDKLKK